MAAEGPRRRNACLDAVLDAYDGVAAYAVIDEAARTARTPGDTRTISQIRAEVLTDLIFGRRTLTPPQTGDEATQPTKLPDEEAAEEPRSRSATDSASGPDGRGPATVVNVMVPLETLASLLPGALPAGHTISQSGWIEGAGVIPGATIRELIRDLLDRGRHTAKLGWRVIACDGTTGAPHALSHTRYRPPQGLQELIQLRDRTCRFPGCRRQTVRCDIDHAEAHHLGGKTCDCNLHSLCRHHHRLKQQPGWTVTLHNGTATWTSPTGHTYIDQACNDWAIIPLPGRGSEPAAERIHASEPLQDKEFWRTVETRRILSDAVPAHDEVSHRQCSRRAASRSPRDG